MLNFSSHLHRLVEKLQDGDLTSLTRSVRNQCIRRHTSVGLRRDLSTPFPTPRAQISLAVYEASKVAVESLASQGTSLSPSEEREVALRLECARANVGRCYIAFTDPGERPCFVQWVFDDRDNDWVQQFFRKRFPILNHGEVLFENAYTPPAFRGLGVMPAAMATIALQEAALGARFGVTFVAHDNIPSLKGCARAGFEPYLSRHDTALCFGLIRKRRFLPFVERRTPVPHVQTGEFHDHSSTN